MNPKPSEYSVVSSITRENRKFFVLFCVVIAVLISDTMISYVTDFIYPELITFVGVTFFIITIGIFILGVCFLLEFVRMRSKEIRAKDKVLKLTYLAITFAEFILISIAIFVVIEILVNSQYHTALLTTVTAINVLLTMCILGLFAQKFFSWFRSNKNSIVVLLYAASFAASSFSFAIYLAYNLSVLLEKESIITPQSKVVFPSDIFEPGSILSILFGVYRYVDMVSFGLLIAATAFLLHHYSERLGKAKYWTIICLPLLYYLFASLKSIGLYVPSTDTELFYYYLLGSLNSTAGGVLFGLAFFTIGKTIREDSPVRKYMVIAAYGFVLLFISNQITLTATSYPPFGLATQSFLILASYMIFLGVYSTAISISQDNQLRKSIKKAVVQNSNLLSSIGTAQMEQEIQKTVNSMKGIVKEQEKELEEQTGIEANLEEDEMKNYLEEVMQEVGKAKKPST